MEHADTPQPSGFLGKVWGDWLARIEQVIVVSLLLVVVFGSLALIIDFSQDSDVITTVVYAAVFYLCLFGAVIATRRMNHIAVDAITPRLEPRLRLGIEGSLLVLAGLVTVAIAAGSYEYVFDTMDAESRYLKDKDGFLWLKRVWWAPMPLFFGWAALHFFVTGGMKIKALWCEVSYEPTDSTFRIKLILAGLSVAAIALFVTLSLGEGSEWTGVGLLAIGAAALLGTPLFIVLFALAMVLYPSVPDGGMSIVSAFPDMDAFMTKEYLLPIPLFTAAGFILAESQAPHRIVRIAKAFMGWAPGGLAVVAVLTLAFFTAFTGASGVTIIALGGMLMPMMLKEGYSERFSLGLITSSGSIGLLFYPSLPVFLYVAVVATNSDGASDAISYSGLFQAALIPGLILVGVLAFYAVSTGWFKKIERTPFSGREVWQAVREGWAELLLPAVAFLSYETGIASFEEVSTITLAYVFVVEVVIHRDIRIGKELGNIMTNALSLVGAIVIILIFIKAFYNYLNTVQLPKEILEFVKAHIDQEDTVLFLIALNIFLLIVGCVMDIFSALVAVVPLLIPLAEHYGIHPLHLGVIFLANLEVGYLTPPVGMNLFISGLHFKKPIMEVARSVIPFMGLLLLALVAITYIEPLSRWLPQTTGKIEHTNREADKADALIRRTLEEGLTLAGETEASKAAEKQLKSEDLDAVLTESQDEPNYDAYDEKNLDDGAGEGGLNEDDLLGGEDDLDQYSEEDEPKEAPSP
jgi:C4-dicarboxylate transporter, DctM subunit